MLLCSALARFFQGNGDRLFDRFLLALWPAFRYRSTGFVFMHECLDVPLDRVLTFSALQWHINLSDVNRMDAARRMKPSKCYGVHRGSVQHSCQFKRRLEVFQQGVRLWRSLEALRRMLIYGRIAAASPSGKDEDEKWI